MPEGVFTQVIADDPGSYDDVTESHVPVNASGYPGEGDDRGVEVLAQVVVGGHGGFLALGECPGGGYRYVLAMDVHDAHVNATAANLNRL